MSVGKIRANMYKNGWISEKLFNQGKISLDLYYLYVNYVDITENDFNYINEGYFDNTTIESQIDGYIDLINGAGTLFDQHLDHYKTQLCLLKSLYDLKLQQLN